MEMLTFRPACQGPVPLLPPQLSIHGSHRAQWRTYKIGGRKRSLLISSVYGSAFARLRHRHILHARAVSNNNGQGSQQDNAEPEKENSNNLEISSLKHVLASSTHRYVEEFQKEMQMEAGVDLKGAYKNVVEFMEMTKQELLSVLLISKRKTDKFTAWFVEFYGVFQQRLWPKFVSWNKFELWKDIKSWDSRRIGVLVTYMLLIAASLRGLHVIFIRPQTVKKIANAYLETVIPEPTYENLRKLRKAMWRQKSSPGFRMQRYLTGPDGYLYHDLSYIGEDPWNNNEMPTDPSKLNGMISENANLDETEKEELRLKVSEFAEIQKREQEEIAKMSWKERLVEWDRLLRLEELKDRLFAQDCKFVIPINLEQVKRNILEGEEQVSPTPPLAYQVSKTWWQYRPKLPYTYFLSKVERQQVESAVYSEDMTKLYVRMKEGFPAEYTVDIPVDPSLFDLLKSCNVKLDMIGKSEWSYYSRAFMILAPSVLILLLIRYFTLKTMSKTSEKIIDLLRMDRSHLILPEDAAEKARSEYKDVVIGNNVWKTLEEIMGYMREPMRYYKKGIFLPRGILISGPPGTGKTLLARAIARESGLPFVFASGAEFVESSSGDGPAKIFNIFFTARANAPSFIFIDEIDALAGRGVNDDPERRATFDQLLAELDGLPEDTDVDRFSLRQSVILICATNRPEELHDSFLRPGRIDREIHIGLPGEEERIGIFGVHSAGRRLAKDVDFRKLVFRTVGNSGADIRNLINEAGIMAVRRGRTEICQQDFIDVLDKQLFEGLGMSMTDEEQVRAAEKVAVETRRLLAVHEAGHVLLAHLFPQFDWHALTHLLPAGEESALTIFYPREETRMKGYTTVGYLKMQMVVAHGGRCAERLVFGDDITDGGQDDLARISKIAREIAISYASPRLGLYPMVFKDKFDPPVPADQTDLIPNNWHRRGNRIANMTMELSEMFTREVTRYSDEAEEEAMKAITMNRHILDKLADELYHRIKMSGLEVEELIKSMNPIMLPDYMERPPVNLSDAKRTGRYEELDIWQAPLPE